MTLLLLAGTGEAKRVAWGLVDSGVPVIASLAGVTRSPEPLPLPTRTGGFGGEAGFAEYLDSAGITAVLDATHPYADQITNRTARVCAARSIPYLQLLRPVWVPEQGDNWTEIASEHDAAPHIRMGATVFLATGRQTLDRFANLEGRRVLCRQIDPPTAPFPFEGGEFIISRPPFSVEREEQLFAALGVDWLIVKNAGGTESRSKLTAARHLGIPVLLLRRPPMPDAPRVETVQEALDWVKAL
jgi:precorrin-6A/cobalt-precorrin-6A reductase